MLHWSQCTTPWRTRRGADITSDHQLVVADMKLKLKKHWTTGQTVLQRFDTAILRHTSKLNAFKITVNNRFQALRDLLKEEVTTMEDIWEGNKEALISKCQEVSGHKKHHLKEWISIETLHKIEKRKSIRADKQKDVEELAKILEKAVREGKMKQLYDITEKLEGKTPTNTITLDGETLNDVESSTYLGIIINERGGSDADVKARDSKARTAFLQLRNIWNSEGLASDMICDQVIPHPNVWRSKIFAIQECAADRSVDTGSSVEEACNEERPTIDCDCGGLMMDPLVIEKGTVLRLLQHLKLDNSSGPDDIHPMTMKALETVIAGPLAILFDISLRHSKLPRD
ncbi:unnamed protein product [Schistosoma mattheei]|uniref:Uncharacterized protein n=1 Tax=Schistosoma mattheei TaxID=31246 RepID=A0A183P5V5_9TREM|nr:unnamed protein product [Schistosoma mattheei]